MKRLLRALTLALIPLAPQAQAAPDVFTLYQSRGWEVFYLSSPGSAPLCNLWTKGANDRNVAMTISSDGRGETSISITNQLINFDGAKGQIDLWIDRREGWYANVDGSGNTLFLWYPQRDLIAEIYQGRAFYVDLGQDGYAEYVFSLRGSAAALHALADCISKL